MGVYVRVEGVRLSVCTWDPSPNSRDDVTEHPLGVWWSSSNLSF